MHGRSLVRAVRSPAATTVFTLVFAMGGLAYAASGGVGGLAFSGGSPHGLGGPGPGTTADASEHGIEVAGLAFGLAPEGWRTGAAVSALASGGRSQAGEHGPHAGEAPGASAKHGGSRGHGPREPHGPPEHAQGSRAGHGRAVAPQQPNEHANEHANPHAGGRPAGGPPA